MSGEPLILSAADFGHVMAGVVMEIVGALMPDRQYAGEALDDIGGNLLTMSNQIAGPAGQALRAIAEILIQTEDGAAVIRDVN